MTKRSEFERQLLEAMPKLKIYAVVLAKTRDKADDLLQETLTQAWAKQEIFKPGSNMKAWLYTIMRNKFYSQMRRRKYEVSDSKGIYIDGIAVSPNQYGHMDLVDFEKVFNLLPREQSETLVLVGMEGFSYQEAAERCGCALGTAKSRVTRMRARLADMLQLEDSFYTPDGLTMVALKSGNKSVAE